MLAALFTVFLLLFATSARAETAVEIPSGEPIEFDASGYQSLDEDRKSLQVDVEKLRAERNASAKNIGKAKAQGEDIAPLLAEVESLGKRLDAAEADLQKVLAAIDEIEKGLPNLLHDDVPAGTTEDDNIEVRRWGEPRSFEFAPLDHVDLGAALGLLDFDAAAKISGARFAVMHGPLARLQRALIQFMLDTHTSEHGYSETYVPYLVQADALVGTSLEASALDALAELAQAACNPIDDKRGTVKFRTHVAGVLARRVAQQAYDRARAAK